MKRILLILVICLLFLAACSDNDVPCDQKDPKSLFDDPDMCYSIKAKKTNDLQLCDKIERLRHRAVCVGPIAGKLENREACKEWFSVETLTQRYPKLHMRYPSGTISAEQVAKNKKTRQEAILKSSNEKTRHCISLYYNEAENDGRMASSIPDDFLDYASYKN